MCRKFPLMSEKKVVRVQKKFFSLIFRPSGVSERNANHCRSDLWQSPIWIFRINWTSSRHRSACTRQWDVKNCDNGRICLRKIDFPSSNERKLRFSFPLCYVHIKITVFISIQRLIIVLSNILCSKNWNRL